MRKILSLVICLFVFSGCVAKHRGLTTDEKIAANGFKGQVYYTQANIWSLNKDRISSKNIHEGVVIPLGTRVNITRCEGAQIRFIDDKNVSYKIIHSRESIITLMELFNYYFSKENPIDLNGKFFKLTNEEQENVKNNNIDYGMSKEAVLMAYGYPPFSRSWTSDINANKWKYIESNRRLVVVYFQDNKVFKIEDVELGLKTPVGRRQKSKVRPGQECRDSNKFYTADEIAKFKKLMDEGAITKEEFDAKKKQLLGV